MYVCVFIRVYPDIHHPQEYVSNAVCVYMRISPISVTEKTHFGSTDFQFLSPSSVLSNVSASEPVWLRLLW